MGQLAYFFETDITIVMDIAFVTHINIRIPIRL